MATGAPEFICESEMKNWFVAAASGTLGEEEENHLVRHHHRTLAIKLNEKSFRYWTSSIFSTLAQKSMDLRVHWTNWNIDLSTIIQVKWIFHLNSVIGKMQLYCGICNEWINNERNSPFKLISINIVT